MVGCGVALTTEWTAGAVTVADTTDLQPASATKGTAWVMAKVVAETATDGRAIHLGIRGSAPATPAVGEVELSTAGRAVIGGMEPIHSQINKKPKVCIANSLMRI